MKDRSRQGRRGSDSRIRSKRNPYQVELESDTRLKRQQDLLKGS